MQPGINIVLATRLSRRLYYGWVIIAVVLLGNLIVFGAGTALGLFITPLEQEFGWDRATIARSMTLGTLLGALVAPVLGMLLDRIGARVLMITLGFCAACLYVGLGYVREAWQFNLLFGLILALSWTGIGQMVNTITTSRWFVRRRGRAMGIVMMGASGGALIWVPASAWLIATVGWREAYLAMAAASLLWICVPAFLFMVNVPEHLGLAEHEELSSTAAGSRHAGSSDKEVDWTLREAIRTRAFWVTLAGVMVGMFGVQGYFLHAIPHMESRGFSRTLASSVWSAFFFVGVIAKFFWGFLIERIGVRWALVMLFVGEALGIYLLLEAPSAGWLFFYAVYNGIAHGPFLQLLAMVWADYFGRRSIGRIYGTVQPFVVVAGSLGPWLGGYAFDVSGDYRGFFHFSMAMCLLAAGLFALDPAPRKPHLAEHPAAGLSAEGPSAARPSPRPATLPSTPSATHLEGA